MQETYVGYTKRDIEDIRNELKLPLPDKDSRGDNAQTKETVSGANKATNSTQGNDSKTTAQKTPSSGAPTNQNEASGVFTKK